MQKKKEICESMRKRQKIENEGEKTKRFWVIDRKEQMTLRMKEKRKKQLGMKYKPIRVIENNG